MLDIQNLSFTYGNIPILKDIQITFQPGEIHGVLGMNGAGKTTFFNNICCLLKPESGTCYYKKKWVSSDDIAYMQTHTYFYPFMQGIEYLELLALQNPDFDITHWNKVFSLPLTQQISGYSTGMKKKLVFMGILAQDRPIMVLDEPFNGVDIESNEKIIQILLHLKSKGKIILLSSHIIHTLTDCCDKISYLKDGNFSRTYYRDSFSELHTLIKDLVSQDVNQILDKS